MLAATCKNCDVSLEPDDHFCPACGQKQPTHRLNMPHIWHEVVHVLTHADKGIFHLTREMALRPGLVAKEYVAGKRKKYYNPFSYLVLAVAISAFLTAYFNLMSVDVKTVNPISKLVTKHINLIFLFSVPVIALYNWALFRKDRYNYAEHLTFSAFMGGFRVVFFVLIFTPLVVLFRERYYQMLGIYMTLWIVFSMWAHTQFYSGPTWLTVLKTLLVIFLTQMTITFLIFFMMQAFLKR